MWQIALIISVILLSVAIILQRLIIHQGKNNPFAYAVIFQGLVGVIIFVAALINGFTFDGLEDYWGLAVLCVVSFALGHLMYAKTLQRVEASLFSLLFATHAVWLMLIGVFLLEESLSLVQLLGAVLIFAAITFPVISNRVRLDRRGIFYGIVCGLLFGMALGSWNYIGRSVDALSWSTITFLIPAILAYFISPASLTSLKKVVSGTNLPKMLLLAAVYGAGSIAMLTAYKYGDFSVVSPLRQTGVILTVFLALLFIPSERNSIGIKVSAAILCSVGAALLVI